MAYLIRKSRVGARRKFHKFTKKELGEWAAAVAVAGMAAAEEWVDHYFEEGKRGADLAYAVHRSLVKFQRGPFRKEQKREVVLEDLGMEEVEPGSGVY